MSVLILLFLIGGWIIIGVLSLVPCKIEDHQLWMDMYEDADPLTKTNMSENNMEKQVILTQQDWADFAEIMRNLTWGKECSPIWYEMNRRVCLRNTDAPLAEEMEEHESRC